MADNVKISILVITHNVESIVGGFIQSLINQTFKDLEIMVIDNASIDNTVEVVSLYMAKESGIRFEKETTFCSIVDIWNKYLPKLQGKYVLFANCGDDISPNYLESLYYNIVAGNNACEIVLNGMSSEYLSLNLNNSMKSGIECLIEIQRDNWEQPMIYGNLYKTKLVKSLCTILTDDYILNKCFIPCLFSMAKHIARHKNVSNIYYHHSSVPKSYEKKSADREAEALSSAGDMLLQYIKTRVNNPDSSIREVLYSYAKHLYAQSQNIYENTLHVSPKKLLFIITEESIGGKYGVGTYIQQLKKCFNLYEWDVNIVTLYKKYDEQRFKFCNGIAYYEFQSLISKYSINHSKENDIYLKGVFYYLASRINEEKKIFCHFNFATHYQLAKLFKEKLHSRIVFTLHYTEWSMDLLGDKDWLKRILQHPISKKDLRLKNTFEIEKTFMKEYCDIVIAIAQHSYKTLHELYGIPLNRLICIPNGLEDVHKIYSPKRKQILRQKYGFSKDENIIIYAGRLDIVKGVVELIKALKDILKIIPTTHLIIAGNGNFKECMKAASQIWKHITFTGYISKQQLYELYAIADIGIVPSIYEEFGYVAVEMLINKLPIIVHNNTGLKEITDNGRIGKSFSFNRKRNLYPLKNAIIDLLKEKPTKYKTKTWRENILKKYSITLFRKRIIAIYDCMDNPYKFINNLNLQT